MKAQRWFARRALWASQPLLFYKNPTRLDKTSPNVKIANFILGELLLFENWCYQSDFHVYEFLKYLYITNQILNYFALMGGVSHSLSQSFGWYKSSL